MRTFLKFTQDASLYQRYDTRNTGLDEILEVGKLIRELDSETQYASGSVRSIIDFPIESGVYPASAQYYLNLYIANAENVKRYQNLEVYLVSSSWVEGSGYFYQDSVNAQDGVTWLASEASVSWSNAGGDYITDTSASYQLSEVPITDFRIDVTQLLGPVLSGSQEMYGFMLKLADDDEADVTNKANIKVFSGNTHTVFEPRLEILYGSQTFSTGSLKPIQSSNISIAPKNLKEEYTIGEIDKIYLNVRDRFPSKQFYDATGRYKNKYYLPSESYYRIRDVVADIKIADFDQYSAIDCDESGSYILLNTTGLDINRYYTLDLKIQSDSLVFYPEFEYTFKVDDDG